MYVTFDEYINLGYSQVLAADFARFERMAEQAVITHTFNRITEENITKINKYGVCELIEIYFFEHNPHLSNRNKILVAFSNEGYSESYRDTTYKSLSVDERINEIISLYFSSSQKFRGLD